MGSTAEMKWIMSFKERREKEKQRKKARKAQKRQVSNFLVGVAWYAPEQWKALTEIVPDRSTLDDTYTQWKAQAEDAIRMIRGQGADAVKVEVDVNELAEWCRTQGRDADAAARVDFVHHILRQRGDPHDHED